MACRNTGYPEGADRKESLKNHRQGETYCETGPVPAYAGVPMAVAPLAVAPLAVVEEPQEVGDPMVIMFHSHTLRNDPHFVTLCHVQGDMGKEEFGGFIKNKFKNEAPHYMPAHNGNRGNPHQDTVFIMWLEFTFGKLSYKYGIKAPLSSVDCGFTYETVKGMITDTTSPYLSFFIETRDISVEFVVINKVRNLDQRVSTPELAIVDFTTTETTTMFFKLLGINLYHTGTEQRYIAIDAISKAARSCQRE